MAFRDVNYSREPTTESAGKNAESPSGDGSANKSQKATVERGTFTGLRSVHGVSAIQLSARVAARPSARRELLQALQEWAAAVRREPAVVAASVYEDVDTPTVFGVVAGWQSEAALDAHLRSRAFGFLLGAVDVLTQTAQVSVTRAMDEYPMDALPAIRRLRHDAAEGDGSRTS